MFLGYHKILNMLLLTKHQTKLIEQTGNKKIIKHIFLGDPACASLEPTIILLVEHVPTK